MALKTKLQQIEIKNDDGAEVESESSFPESSVVFTPRAWRESPSSLKKSYRLNLSSPFRDLTLAPQTTRNN